MTPETSVSKSKFKARALEYFRQVERTGQPLVVTDHGRPVLRIVPYREEPSAALQELRETVVRYDAPTDPADRIIVSTALSLGAKLVTKDDKLRRYKHVESIC